MMRVMRRLTGAVLLLLMAAGPAGAQLRTVPFVSGLTAPLAIVQDPVDPAVQFVVEQGGRIRYAGSVRRILGSVPPSPPTRLRIVPRARPAP
jgi:hypothetical protein